MISRRTMILAAVGSVSTGQMITAQSGEVTSIKGKLIQTGPEPVLRTTEGQTIRIKGDEPTTKILHDARLNGRIFEARGHAAAADNFVIDPIETRPMVVMDGAKRFRVTYYCDVCSIRTYSPGPCMCCQAETRLDLIDPAAKE